ncbi:MAG: SRPBCC family protein [Pseudomonadota bacterium]
MGERLQLQWRRLLWHGVYAVLFLAQLRGGLAWDGGVLLAALAGIALSVAAVMALPALLIPIDILLLALLCFQLLDRGDLVSGVAALTGVELSGFTGWVLYFAVGAAVIILAMRLNRVHLPGRLTVERSRWIDAPPGEVWRRFASADGQPWGPTVLRIEGRFALGEDRVFHTLGSTEEKPERYTETLVALEEGVSLTKRAVAIDETLDLDVMHAFTTAPEAGGTRLTVREEIARFPVLIALAGWLDDFMADDLAHFAAIIEDRRDWSIKGAMVGMVSAETNEE